MDLEDLSKRDGMNMTCSMALREHCFISAPQKSVPYLFCGFFFFIIEKDGVSSSVNHCFTNIE